jgi:[ribosomal protein S5]-alanine N-acetyltransferase
MNPGFSPFPILTTERLVLRKLADADKKEIFFIRSDQEINKYIDRPLLTHLDGAESFISKINEDVGEERCLYWSITLKDNPVLIGTICLWHFSADHTEAELGYELIPAYQGRGLLQEAMLSVIHYGFGNILLKRIEAYTHKDNLRSIRLLEKNGFIRESQRIDNDHSSNLIFSITGPEASNS